MDKAKDTMRIKRGFLESGGSNRIGEFNYA